MKVGDRVEVQLDGKWHDDARIVDKRGAVFSVRLPGRREDLAYGDPAAIPGAEKYIRPAAEYLELSPPAEQRVTSSTGGQKGKKEARYDLIPGRALEKIAKLYGRGAGKYEDRNWERGYEWSLSFAALQRHIWQFWNGEDMDEEMQMPHVACAIFHAMALLEFMEEHPEFDDRPATLKKRALE